ncbi:hypothetical protein KKF91_02840 [Myxococcota bacterium]|nr:hypothetical protein [Myxococcota bacterium]MBU1429476.1 hypothetical protein [Myxococcota bacterium]MBU1896148.1 hypothetical protein [Myxococcota bacterium]
MTHLRLALIGLLALLALSGCSKPADKIVGTWTVDIESLDSDPSLQKLEGDQKKAALEMAKKMMADMSFEFTKDGKMKMAFGKMAKEGTYKVTKTEGNTVTIEGTMKEGQGDKAKDKTEELKIEVLKDKIKITGPDKKSITFARKA